MCIGILMQVMALEEGELFAHCLRWPASEFQSQTERVDLQLVAGVQPGDWLLVFMGAAREAMTPERAAQVGQALQALEAVESGNLGLLDELFADLQSEPQLPPHLQAQLAGQAAAPKNVQKNNESPSEAVADQNVSDAVSDCRSAENSQ